MALDKAEIESPPMTERNQSEPQVRLYCPAARYTVGMEKINGRPVTEDVLEQYGLTRPSTATIGFWTIGT